MPSDPPAQPSMQAKCPHCFGERADCERCGGSGFIDVSLARGAMYTQHCNACGEDNGGRITGPDLPPIPEGRPQPCVWCKSPDTEWLLVGVLE